jgi:hypothetical protein
MDRLVLGHFREYRKARYYRLTAAGRKQLAAETSRWERLVSGISRVLRPATD